MMEKVITIAENPGITNMQCPVCLSSNIQTGNEYPEYNGMHEDAVCLACNAHFLFTYHLAQVTIKD